MSKDGVTEEQQVVAFLEANPDLLSRHPELVESLVIPHAAGDTASLVEYQAQVLRDRNRDLTSRLRDYLQRAEENEALLRRVHGFCLEIAAVDSAPTLVAMTRERLLRDFGCDFVSMGGFSERDIDGWQNLGEEAARDLESFRVAHRGVCGRLSRDRLRWLFDEGDLGEIQSGAMVTLGPPGFGILAVGSREEHRFFPGMGTLFLELLAQMVGQRLIAVDGEHADR
ncbi:MAG: DUF484 family protein [Xanthomonadales bacterium]|nr:DUF484 family protein [Xanthomonadales bacterium]